ncbi:hypothetical protein CROQUDRAFT_87823 [Cronartium quercuum f. sp. fusiforme G11]|uniref:Uncharacterized protein n=1 Tax=Cronartium quercuum f. sp. fusiforme G11 TaxID=708437 RepID=A0A9P6NNY2_9BASI|nr:hypothetical protein CROQUDRAFT_87823 [Cronartium quercuum f. sp. fusiforme G11]
MSESVEDALLNVMKALGDDFPTAEEVTDHAPVTTTSSWAFCLPESIPPRRPS